MTLSRDEILAQVLEVREVETTAGTVRIQELPADEAETFWSDLVAEQGAKGGGTPPNFRARLLVKSVVDDTGDRIFTDDDAELLARKSSSFIQQLFEVASEMSGITEGEIEEIAGNSDGESGDSSPTDSPETSDG